MICLLHSLQTLVSVTSVEVTTSSRPSVALQSMLPRNCSGVAADMGQKLTYGVCEYLHKTLIKPPVTDTQDKEGGIFDQKDMAIHKFFHCDCVTFLLNYPIIESNYCRVQC